MSDAKRETQALRDRIVTCAMAYAFGDYPGTEDIASKSEALAALEEACMELEAIERMRERADARRRVAEWPRGAT